MFKTTPIMIFTNKHLGETPLELLERLRREQPELKSAKLSYAGRLDPMAEGQMLVLVGEENKNREKYLGLDKEYIATFLIGVKTDTGDVLGLVQKIDNMIISRDEISTQLENLKSIKEQKYPWFSGQTVDGLKLFDHYKAGNFDIERPTRKVQIKEVELLNYYHKEKHEVKKYIVETIGLVMGDFRQKKIVTTWNKFFEEEKEHCLTDMSVFEIKILVSSGTYIRALTDEFSFPTTLYKLKRTRILDR